MSKPLKVLLGVVTLWPLLYMGLFFCFIFLTMLMAPRSAETAGGFPAMFVVIFALHLLTMLVILGLTIFYMVNVFRNERVDKDKKVLWAIVIFMGNVVAMPIYWYLYFWKEPAIAAGFTPGQLNSVDTSAWTNQARKAKQAEYVPPQQPPNWRE